MAELVILDGYCVSRDGLAWEALQSLAGFTVYPRTPEDLTVERAKDADCIFTNKTVLDRRVLELLPKLKYIGILATGYNVVDLEAAKEFGITVTNVPAYSTESVVQTTFGLITGLYAKICENAEVVRSGGWQKATDFSAYSEGSRELFGKTVGIVGYGTIGRRVAEVALAFGCKVVVFNKGKTYEPKENVKYLSSAEELYAISDIITLHCPLSAQTAKLINADAIVKMKDGVTIINTARGGLVDEEALANALKLGKVGGFGADVLSKEPPTSGNPLIGLNNTLITAHAAWATQEARARLASVAVSNLRAFLNGAPVNVVNY